MAFVPKITVSEFVEREISIRYKRLPIVNFVNLIKSGVELGKFERYVIEFFREVKPENRRKFNQNIFVDDDIEIVTKKVFFRGASLHPRDLYDLATVYLGPRRSELVNALINIPEQLQEFHDALQRVGPGFSFSEDYGLDLVLDIPLGLNGREVDICIDLCNEVRKSLV